MCTAAAEDAATRWLEGYLERYQESCQEDYLESY